MEGMKAFFCVVVTIATLGFTQIDGRAQTNTDSQAQGIDEQTQEGARKKKKQETKQARHERILNKAAKKKDARAHPRIEAARKAEAADAAKMKTETNAVKAKSDATDSAKVKTDASAPKVQPATQNTNVQTVTTVVAPESHKSQPLTTSVLDAQPSVAPPAPQTQGGPLNIMTGIAPAAPAASAQPTP